MLMTRNGELNRAQPYQPYQPVEYPPKIRDGESVQLRLAQHGKTLHIQNVQVLPDGYQGTLTGISHADDKSVDPPTVGLTYGQQVNFRYEQVFA